MAREQKRILHNIDPVYDADSRVLILGSFPSVKSREQKFFYGHPQNRFWKVLAGVLEGDAGRAPGTVAEKRAFLLSHGVAVWDVVGSCDIRGSSDASIKNVVPNDVGKIIEASRIDRIFVNGKTAARYYDRYLKDRLGMQAVVLPSTSPANAAWKLDRLIEAWGIINE